MAGQRLSPGPVPLYYQLKQILRSAIERGEYQPGDQLPSEPELTRNYGISRITARQALDELETEGLVIRRHGKGTYVSEQLNEPEPLLLTELSEDLKEAELEPSSRLLTFIHEQASARLAKSLQLEAGEEVVRIDQLRLGRDKILAYDTTSLPAKYGNQLSGVDLTHESLLQALEVRAKIPVEHGSFTISATNASEEQANILEVPAGSALLVMRSLAYTIQNEPLYVQERFFLPEHVHYQGQLQRRPTSLRGAPYQVSTFSPIFELRA